MRVSANRIEELATLPDDEIDLARAALTLALEEYPGLDVESYLRRLDELGVSAREEVRPDLPVADQVAALNHFLFEEQGFRGNEGDYDDPRNSFLNEVLDRRTGIPITLSLVYCEVARRLHLPIVGVAFPGRFLVRHVGDPPILIDPFSQSLLSLEDCQRRIQARTGSREPLDPFLLRPAKPREILVRMVRNLKRAYLQRRDFIRALAASNRILLLAPDQPNELRDRGTLYMKLECFAAALRDFERFLEIAPNCETAAALREIVPELERQASRLQ